MSRSLGQGRPRALGSDQHLPRRLRTEAEQSPHQPVLAAPANGSWTESTRGELAESIRLVAAGLIARGLGAGDRLAVMSNARLDWTSADLAVLAAGAVAVPGYETSSAEQCRATPSEHRIGTAGRRMPGVEVSLADDGEIMVKRHNLLRGYHGDAERTARDFDGGWFNTGDLGKLDYDGFLMVLDRKNDLIASEQGLSGDIADLRHHDRVSSEIQAAVDRANEFQRRPGRTDAHAQASPERDRRTLRSRDRNNPCPMKGSVNARGHG